jgi:hypothetical protein
LDGGLRLLWSNIGLNAIAQWTFTTHLMPQGLGTGGLYTNNFECLVVSEGQLWYEKVKVEI